MSLWTLGNFYIKRCYDAGKQTWRLVERQALSVQWTLRFLGRYKVSLVNTHSIDEACGLITKEQLRFIIKRRVENDLGSLLAK